ncbi:MAG: hypothetical protein GY899_07400 [Verrucomicrobiaceae bacterium]|nr:hypothetical protein [Verrucomicrobiaceae bacterium]
MKTATQVLTGAIWKVLSGKDENHDVEQTAREFVDLCSDVAERLEGCRDFKVEGEEEKAVDLAEKEPPLMEALETLAKFRQRQAWADYCRKHSLPVAPEIDREGADWVLGLYKQWEGTSKLLWKKYRDAVIRKDQQVMISVIHRIIKLDPSDRSALDENNRIMRRYFREQKTELEKLVDAGEQDKALELADGLDRLPFDKLKRGRAWETAIKWRNALKRESDEKKLDDLIAELPGQCESRELESVRESVAESRTLLRIHKFDLEGEEKGRLDDAEAWIPAEEDRLKKEGLSKEAVERCMKELTRIEGNWAVVSKGSVGSASEERRKLSNSWREVEKIGSGIGHEFSGRVSAARQKLDVIVANLKKKRMRKIRTVAAVLSMIGLAVSYYFYAQWRSTWMIEKFAVYKGKGLALPLRKLVDSTNTYRKPIELLAHKPFASRLKSARAWLEREEAHMEGVKETIRSIDKETAKQFTRPIDDYYAEVEAIEGRIADAVTDLSELLAREMGPFKKRWLAHVDAYVNGQNERRNKAISEMADVLQSAPALQVAARDDALFEQVNALVVEVRDAMQTIIPPSKPLEGASKQVKDLGPQLTDLSKRMELFRGALEAANKAASLADYNLAMKRFQEGPFENTPERAAAIEVLGFEKTITQVTGEIIAPGDPRAWAFFQANRNKVDLYPKVIEESERVVLEQLSKDEKLEELYRCAFREVPSGKIFVRYCAGPVELRKRRVGPVEIVERLGDFFQGGRFGIVKYEFKSVPAATINWVGTDLTSEEISTETNLFRKIRPNETLMSQSQQYYRSGVLSVFDDILSATDVHPLFKAYMQVELSKVIMRRAHEWGTLFAPSVVSDFQEIKAIVPALLGRHDWLWTDKYPEQEKAIADFYAKRGDYSYVKESKVNRNLIEEAIKSGFGLAGYMDIDRQPVLLPEAEQASKIYGSLTPNVPATTVLQRTGDEQWQKVGNAAPFTPLFFFKGDSGKIMEEVADKEGEDVDRIRTMSLPFFR